MIRHIPGLAYNNSQFLDLHLVDAPGRPLVVCLHGGGFHAGSRDDKRCKQSAALLVEAGFNCASVSYSLASRDNRFAMWPRNLFDVADALAWLHAHAPQHGYSIERFGMLGFSAGCCLSNLYIQGGNRLFSHFGYATPVYCPAALVGFYGPYDFSSRQPERRSGSTEIDRDHSPAHWLRQDSAACTPPVLHIQGDCDNVVYPQQHLAFQKDYLERGLDFREHIVEGFGHAFAPVDSNTAGKTIDLRSEITDFFIRQLLPGTG